MRNLIAAGLFLVLGLVSPVIAEVKTGGPAPGTLTFTTWDGTTTNLDAYKGKIVVLEWFNAECPFVKKHYKPGNMQSLQKEYTAKGVTWLAVNSSAPGKQGALSAETAKQVMSESNAAATAVVLDPTGALGKAFGARTTPHMFVVNKEGIVVYQGAIDDNDSARSETIKGAKNYVRAALDEVLENKPVTVAQSDAYGCSVKYAS